MILLKYMCVGAAMFTVKEKKVLTPDLDGTATTSQVGDEVISKLRQ